MTDQTPVILPDYFEGADYEYWARLKSWSEQEAVALALGYQNQTNNSPDVLHRVLRGGGQIEKDFLRRADQMFGLVNSHFGDPYTDVGIHPRTFLAWLHAMSLWIPPGMEDAVEAYAKPQIDWQARALDAEQKLIEKEKELTKLQQSISADPTKRSSETRERDTLLKLFIAMAIEKYHYEPNALKNSATGNIRAVAERNGFPVSDDTVRKYLSEPSPK